MAENCQTVPNQTCVLLEEPEDYESCVLGRHNKHNVTRSAMYANVRD